MVSASTQVNSEPHLDGSSRSRPSFGNGMANSPPQNTRVVWLIALSTGSHLSGKVPWKPCTFGRSVILSHSMVSMRMRARRECILSFTHR